MKSFSLSSLIGRFPGRAIFGLAELQRGTVATLERRVVRPAGKTVSRRSAARCGGTLVAPIADAVVQPRSIAGAPVKPAAWHVLESSDSGERFERCVWVVLLFSAFSAVGYGFGVLLF